MKLNKAFILFYIIIISSSFIYSVDRFPRPEFESQYKMPETQTPVPRGIIFDIADIVILILMLSIASYVILKKKSRIVLLIIMALSIGYFGFFKRGCICPIGSVQNVISFLVSDTYLISIFTLLLFIIPVIYTIFFGRSFCSSVCPLGAVQELVMLKPLKIPDHIDKVLRLLPFLYLFLVILFVINGAGFVICTIDPFVSFFRMSGDLWKIIYSGIFLIISIFIARPYCRYLCPYALILGFVSKISRRHINLAGDECSNCGICDVVCPVNSIEEPVEYENKKMKSSIRLLIIITPVIIIISGISGYFSGNITSAFHPAVKLAREMAIEEKEGKGLYSIDSAEYRNSNGDLSRMFNDSVRIIKIYKIETSVLFILLAFVFLVFIYFSFKNKSRKVYSVNKFTCLSCMKCIEKCPKE
jgi:NosR/NirI family transcriptional regulator, nitrous oxide reductase regulator